MLEDELDLIIANGWTPSRMSVEDFRAEYLDPDRRDSLRSRMKLWESYVRACRTMAIYRHAIAKRLNELADNPEEVVDGHIWRQTQKEYLEAVAWGLRHGYMHLLAKIPTGGGKSHAIGAEVRAVYDAREILVDDDRLDEKDKQLLGLHKEIEIVVLTSRKNLVHQLITEGNQAPENGNTNGDPAASEMDDEEEVKIGDIRQWISDIIPEEAIRVIVTGASMAEREKDAYFTMQTYQGATSRRIQQIHQRRVVALFADESHNLTGPKGTIIRQGYSAALRFGVSATPQGPDRDPFGIFEEVIRDPDTDPRRVPWHEKLAYHATMADLIRQRELKPLRWITAETGLSLEGVALDSPDDVVRFFKRNLNALKSFVDRIFTERHPALELAHSRPLMDRRHIFFFEGLDICEEMARFINRRLPTEMTSGNDSKHEFDRKKNALHSGQLRALISDTKLREGFDVPETDCVWIIRPHKKAWIIEQEVGRGERLVPGDPNADNLVIEPFYLGEHHALSVLDLFGEYQTLNGGLLAAPANHRELELKVFRLLQEGYTLGQIRDERTRLLTREEREQLDLWWGPQMPSMKGGGGGREIDITPIDITGINLVEREDVQQRLFRASPESLCNAIREEFTPQQWMTMTVIQKSQIQVAGLGLIAISRLFNIEGDCVKQTEPHIALGRIIFVNCPEFVLPQQDALRATIRGSLVASGVTAEKWAVMNQKEKLNFKIEGMGLFALASVFGISGNPSSSHPVHLNLGREIFGVDCEEAFRQSIRTLLKTEYSSADWAALKISNLSNVKCNGLAIVGIARLFGISGKIIIMNQTLKNALGQVLYGAEYKEDSEEKTRNEIRRFIIERYTPERWAQLKGEEKKAIQYEQAGKPIGLKKIASLFGVTNDPRGNTKEQIRLGRAIWGNEWPEELG